MKHASPEGPVSRAAVAELPLWDVPDIRSEAPSQAASETSRRAAECINNPVRRESHRKIMRALAEASAASRSWLSMYEIGVAAGLPINVVCARVPELEPLWVERKESAVASHAKPSLRVDGFRLTFAGLNRWHDANAPLPSCAVKKASGPLEGAA